MKFWKTQGVGNDFVTIDVADSGNADLDLLAKNVCSRNTGVGADGLLVLHRNGRQKHASFRMQMFNPDGTEDMCGNGLRCAILCALENDWISRGISFQVDTLSGLRNAAILSVSPGGNSAIITAEMGTPRFESSEIPVLVGLNDRVIEQHIRVDRRDFEISCVNTGSTHTVVFGQLPSDADFFHFSPLFENLDIFPERTSVLWASQDGAQSFQTRIWERGAGETLGCGTGACAVGVAAIVTRRVPQDSTIDICSKGGTLEVLWEDESAPVQLTGNASIVFSGEIV